MDSADCGQQIAFQNNKKINVRGDRTRDRNKGGYFDDRMRKHLMLKSIIAKSVTISINFNFQVHLREVEHKHRKIRARSCKVPGAARGTHTHFYTQALNSFSAILLSPLCSPFLFFLTFSLLLCALCVCVHLNMSYCFRYLETPTLIM